jgi:hypothetical protein
MQIFIAMECYEHFNCDIKALKRGECDPQEMPNYIGQLQSMALNTNSFTKMAKEEVHQQQPHQLGLCLYAFVFFYV